MSYCTPREPNFGFLNHGCNAYGGLLLNEKLFFQSPRTCESVFIPQHNLGNYWKRPYLDPHALGFSKFLTHLFDKDESADILTENTILHGRSLCRRNRNLLTGCALDESTVQFWTCNERSARRRILEFSLSQECFDNGEETWNILPKNGDTSPVKVAEMQSPLVQLRHLSKINEQNFLFGQCIDGLFVINTTSKAISAVFSGAIENFSLVPYLQNEVIILDSGHLLWHGDLNATTTLSRVKTSSFIQHISSSDHPRKLYTAGYDKVYVTDLRESSSPGKELFSIPDYGSTDNCAPKIRYGECFTKPVIKHLQSPNNVYRNLLVATSKKFYLLDERMPFKPCLETAHSIFGGGDYICCAPPFSDNENTAGSVYGFYILQHSLPSDVQYFSLYDHGNALQWSMISPIKRFMEPSGAVDFYNQQPKYGIFINSRHKAALFGFEKTKAIHVQDGLAKNKHGYERHLLLRQTGNGSIWLDSLTIVNDDCLEDEALQNNAREIRQRVYSLIQCEEPYTVGGGFKKDFCKIYPDEMTYCKRIKKTGAEKGIESHFSPLDVSCCTDYPIPEVAITTDNSEKLISKLVSDCFFS